MDIEARFHLDYYSGIKTRIIASKESVEGSLSMIRPMHQNENIPSFEGRSNDLKKGASQ